MCLCERARFRGKTTSVWCFTVNFLVECDNSRCAKAMKVCAMNGSTIQNASLKCITSLSSYLIIALRSLFHTKPVRS